MRLFDLTRGKYPQIYDGSEFANQYEDQLARTIHANDSFLLMFQK